MPVFAQIEPVGQCNLRCQMCAVQFRRDGPPHGPPAFMDFAMFTSLIDQLAGVKELHLQGLGEPMMHPRFFDMVSYAVANGMVVTTNSNMTLLNPERAKRAVESGLHSLHVSIDGATAETYERIRVRSHFDRVLRNVRLLVDARTGSEVPSLRMVVVVMRQNLAELPDLVRLACDLSMESVFVQHLAHDFAESGLPSHYRSMRDFVEGQTLAGMEVGRVEHYFERARAVAADVGIVLRLPRVRPTPHPPGTTGRARCDWPWRGPYISYDGTVMPCCMIGTPDRGNFGRIDEQRTTNAVWLGEGYRLFRRELNSAEPPDICRSCSVYAGTF